MSFRTVLSARHSAVLRKLALVTLCAVSMSLFLTASAEKLYPEPAAKDGTCFLFAYAKGNSPEQDHICYAVSGDGLRFFALNSGMPLIYEKTPSGSVGIRRPDLMRAEDGGFRMVATDTPPFGNAPDAGRGLLLMKSDDLVGWSQKTIDFRKRFPDMPRMQDLMEVVYPHAIYDPAAKKYLVYFTLVFRNGGNNNKVYGAYANADFTDLEGEPRLMVECNSTMTIDAAVIPSDGTYFMFFNGRKAILNPSLFRFWTRKSQRRKSPAISRRQTRKRMKSFAPICTAHRCFRDKSKESAPVIAPVSKTNWLNSPTGIRITSFWNRKDWTTIRFTRTGFPRLCPPMCRTR